MYKVRSAQYAECLIPESVYLHNFLRHLHGAPSTQWTLTVLGVKIEKRGVPWEHDDLMLTSTASIERHCVHIPIKKNLWPLEKCKYSMRSTATDSRESYLAQVLVDDWVYSVALCCPEHIPCTQFLIGLYLPHGATPHFTHITISLRCTACLCDAYQILKRRMDHFRVTSGCHCDEENFQDNCR